MKPNQIRIKFFNSERLLKLDGYLDYTLTCDPKLSYTGWWEFHKSEANAEIAFTHSLPERNLSDVLKTLKEGELSITLRKSKLGGMIKTDIETIKFKLLPFGTMCTIAREVTIQSQKFKVEVSVHKATHKK